ERLVSAHRNANARGAHDSKRHQQTALRDSDGHQESQNERDQAPHGPGFRRTHARHRRDRKSLRAAEDQAGPDLRRRPQIRRSAAGRKAALRGARAMSILAVLEQQNGSWHRMSLETLAAAQELAGAIRTDLELAVAGSGIGSL